MRSDMLMLFYILADYISTPNKGPTLVYKDSIKKSQPFEYFKN
jgi:hypothetical protein